MDEQKAMPKVPAVGEVAPEIELPDSTGVRRRLSELIAHETLVVVFYRGNS
jgi:peroxiredoxin